MTKTTTWPLALTVREQGDANHYAILNGDNWLAALQINGEMTASAQNDLVRIMAAAPILLDALNHLQANPNDPRAHHGALEALKVAGSTGSVRNYFADKAKTCPPCEWGPRRDGVKLGEECRKCGFVMPF